MFILDSKSSSIPHVQTFEVNSGTFIHSKYLNIHLKTIPESMKLSWCRLFKCVRRLWVCVPAFLSNFHSDPPQPPSTPPPSSCLPSLLALFLLLSIQLGITGLHIIFCSTSESRLFKISVIFLSLCVYRMGFVCASAERLCLSLPLTYMHCI